MSSAEILPSMLISKYKQKSFLNTFLKQEKHLTALWMGFSKRLTKSKSQTMPNSWGLPYGVPYYLPAWTLLLYFKGHMMHQCIITPLCRPRCSVGCAVRLETRRSRVQPPPRSATFFRGDWSWNIFYGHSLPSADSRRAVVSFWRKNVHNTG